VVYIYVNSSLSCSEAEIAVAVARQREMKWLDMFRNWDKWVSRRFQKVCFLFEDIPDWIRKCSAYEC